MANYAKYTKGAMGHLVKHFERAKDNEGNYIKFGNQDINASKTHLNYNLAPEHNQLDFIHKRLEEVYCINRKDVNVMCSWVITAPQDLDPEQGKQFFQESYNFLEKKYGEKNVVSAYVHLDEKTPHMHFCFMPIVPDVKHVQGEKVSAKECVTRLDLQQFHEQLQNHLHKNNIICSIINGATLEGNKSVEELKRGTARQTLKKIRSATKKGKEELNNLQKQKDVLEREINALKDLKKIQGNILSNQQIKNIKMENVIFDNEKVKISKNDLLDLQKSALMGAQADQIYKSAVTYLQKAEKILKQTEDRRKEPVKETMERVMLKKKLEDYDKALDKCSMEVRQAFNNAFKMVTESQQKNHKITYERNDR